MTPLLSYYHYIILQAFMVQKRNAIGPKILAAHPFLLILIRQKSLNESFPALPFFFYYFIILTCLWSQKPFSRLER